MKMSPMERQIKALSSITLFYHETSFDMFAGLEKVKEEHKIYFLHVHMSALESQASSVSNGKIEHYYQ